MAFPEGHSGVWDPLLRTGSGCRGRGSTGRRCHGTQSSGRCAPPAGVGRAVAPAGLTAGATQPFVGPRTSDLVAGVWEVPGARATGEPSGWFRTDGHGGWVHVGRRQGGSARARPSRHDPDHGETDPSRPGQPGQPVRQGHHEPGLRAGRAGRWHRALCRRETVADHANQAHPGGGKSYPVEVPAGAVFAGRLVDSGSKVTAGMPIVSAKYAGYGLVADIDGSQAYKISGGLGSVQAQIKGGPGPFPCTVLGTIAALPAGTIPEPPAPQQPVNQPQGPPGGVKMPDTGKAGTDGSEATGMRLVCTAPVDVRLINGAAATVEVVTERAVNALVLPVEAVAGSQGKGKVDVVKPDRTRETRDVVLGLTDGRMIEIKSGLTGDETIAVPGPSRAPPKPEQNGEPGGPGGPGMTGAPK